MKSLVLLMLLFPSLVFAIKIDGKKTKDAPRTVDGIEYRITKLLRFAGYLHIEITNHRDTVIIIDCTDFAAIDSKGNQLNVQTTGIVHIDKGYGNNFEINRGGTFESIKKIFPSAKLKLQIPFDGRFKHDKEKPIVLYFRGENFLIFINNCC